MLETSESTRIDAAQMAAATVAPTGLTPQAKSFLWVAGLLLVCYAPILQALVNQWMNDEDMGHGFFVPAIAGYIVWQRRGELTATSFKSNPLGLLFIFLGACQAIVGSLGAEFFVSRTAFLVSVFGCVLYAGGWKAIRMFAFPLFLLGFMIPIPAIVYNQITFPLQLLASSVAETVLKLCGIPVVRDGNILELPSQKLSVVEACSGIRSLLSLSFLSLVFGYLFDKKVWMKWLLLGLIIPIAIAANASRVTLTGMLSEINVEYAQGIYHSLSGWVVFMVALVMLVITHNTANAIYKRICRGQDAPKGA
ncbi:MAG: exosortase/archaeosortase family protein [Candidatus Solibacter usitatus]|nr:exosortase/archaeosortase family protein [Candidatus Solibacter usitatus]